MHCTLRENDEIEDNKRLVVDPRRKWLLRFLIPYSLERVRVQYFIASEVTLVVAFNADFIETVQAYGPAFRTGAGGDPRELSKLTPRRIDFVSRLSFR